MPIIISPSQLIITPWSRFSLSTFYRQINKVRLKKLVTQLTNGRGVISTRRSPLPMPRGLQKGASVSSWATDVKAMLGWVTVATKPSASLAALPWGQLHYIEWVPHYAPWQAAHTAAAPSNLGPTMQVFHLCCHMHGKKRDDCWKFAHRYIIQQKLDWYI